MLTYLVPQSSLAHLNPDQIGNQLARLSLGNSFLRITDIYSGGTQGQGDFQTSSSGRPTTTGSSRRSNLTAMDTNEEDNALLSKKRSLWIPNDAMCPRVWCVSSSNTQLGPYRVSELIRELEKGNITLQSLVCPLSTEEVENNNAGNSSSSAVHNALDTGRWKPLKDYFQLQIQILSPGKALYSPAEVGLKFLSVLQSLAEVHKYSNSRGLLFIFIALLLNKITVKIESIQKIKTKIEYE